MNEDRKEHPEVKRSMQLFVKYAQSIEDLMLYPENYDFDQVSELMAPLNLRLEEGLSTLSQFAEKSKNAGTGKVFLPSKTKPALRVISCKK